MAKKKKIEQPKLKKSLIGGYVYVPLLKGTTKITEDKTEMFRNLGMNQLFENDVTHTKKPSKPRSTNTKRVGKHSESD